MRFKNIKTVALFVLLCLGMGARADNIVKISSAQGATGDEVAISISLNNSEAVSSLQLSIPLDENLSLVENSGQLASRCGSHSMNVGVKDGELNIMIFSLSMAAMSDNSGEVASFKLKLGNCPTQLTLQPSKTVLTGTDGNVLLSSSESGSVTILCALAQYSAETIDFERVPINGSYTKNLIVNNIGNADLVIKGLQFTDGNTLSSTTSFPVTVSAGGSTQLNITYSPTVRGTMVEWVKVVCNSTSKQNTITLKAIPYAVNELHILPASGISDEEVTIQMTMNNMDAIAGMQVDFDLPEQLKFVDGSFELSGRKTDHVGTASSNGNHVSMAAYSVSNSAFAGNDDVIGSFKVKLVGHNGAELSPSKTVLSAFINNKVENVLSDVYGAQITISSPQISTDDNLDFGTVVLGEACEKTFTIRNYGNAPMTISKIVFTQENFYIKETLPLTIDQYGSKNITIGYDGEEQTTFNCLMTIYSNDPEQGLRNVNISGYLLANSLDIDIPDVFIDDNLVINLTGTTYDVLTGLQFDLEYPSEQFETYDENYALTSRTTGMSVASSKRSDNTLRYLCYFMSGGIAQGSGELMTIQFKPKESVSEGTYNVSLKNIKLVTSNAANTYAGTDVSKSFKVKKHDPVTITAKSYSREYGSDNPTFEFTSEGAIVVGSPEITCEATATSPVGTYPIVITKGSVENDEVTYVNGTLTITAKTVESPTVTLSQTSYIFDGSEKKPTVTVADGGTTISSDEYTVSYSNNTNVGTATVTITDKEGGNYNVSGSATFAITAADGSLTPPTGKTGLVYTGAAQDLITAGSCTTGTLQYSLDGTNYGTTIPQGTDAKEYTVYYQVKGDANHSDIPAASFKVSIAAKTVSSPTITLSQTSYIFDGSEKKPTVTVADGGTTISSDEYTVSYSNNTNVGTATVTITDKEGGNYNVSGSATFAITAADGSLTPPTGKTGLVYTGAAQDLITAGSCTTGTLQYSLDGTNFGTIIPQGTDAKEYTVYYRVQGDANHSDIPATSFKVTIAAKTVSSPTITLSQTSYIFDGSEKKPTVTVADGGTTISSDEYTVSYSNNTNVGTATVTITDKEGGNYNVSGSATFAITAADGSLTPPTGKTGLVYTGAAQDLITAGSCTTGTLQYSLDGTNFGTIIPQGTDAKEYTVYYRVQGDANHSDIPATSFKVTIAKAPLKITAKSYTRKQGEANPDFGVTYEGFKNNETDAVLTTKPTVSCAATKDSPAGSYDITVSGAVAGNYEISYVAGTLTVEAVTPPTPEPQVTTFDEDVDNSASNKIIITFVVKENDSSGTPTVAISDDKDASGSVSISETVTHNGVEYKVTEIGEGAFQNNTGLTEVSIPASITSIGASAFAGCTNLKSITVYNETPINLSVVSARGFTRTGSGDVFEGVDKETCILYVPEGSVDAYKAAPGWKDFKNILAIGTTGIYGIVVSNGEAFDVFSISGQKVKSKATSLDGLPMGIYIINGKKVIKK